MRGCPYTSGIIQAAIPDPDKSQVTTSMTGTVTFGKTGSPDVDITGWQYILVVPDGDCYYYYNDESTKTMRLFANKLDIVWVLQENVDSVTFIFGTVVANVQGE